jgi:DNA-binding SARP family transcriptional activator
LFGGLRASTGDGQEIRCQTPKTGVLLAYLAYHLRRPAPQRSLLIDLLWPEAEPRTGQNRLRQTLFSLRRQLEPPGILPGSVLVADHASVRLNPVAVTTDVGEFEATLRATADAVSGGERISHLSRAVELYRGELLAGYYEAWILQERDWLAERYHQALGQWVAHLEQIGDLHCAIEYARRGVLHDPLREESHQELIRVLAAAGQRAAALHQYRELERILREELGAPPAAATRALVRMVEAGRSAPAAPAPPRGSPVSGPSSPVEAEKRLVSILCVATGAASLAQARIGSVSPVHRFLDGMVDALLVYGGRSVDMSETGATAVFGAFPAHEDDAERAVRAALALREMGCRWGLAPRVAIATV